ncbi:MAG: SCP2 sterol-binding domain-containing protein [Myxococcota bacterium]
MPGREAADDAPLNMEGAQAWMRDVFRPEAAKGVQAIYQLELTGKRACVVWARVDDGRLSLGDGRTPGPDVVFRMDSEDFFGVLEERENPDLLYMEDRIEISGSLSLALKLRLIFSGAKRA